MFKIGDKVRVIKDYWSARKDEEGIIRALPKKNGSSRAYVHCYSVEFPAWKKNMGHTCGGTVPSGKGQWIEPECLELIKSASAEKIVITHDGKTTLAKLYENDKVIKSAEAKCSFDDTFDFATGASLAFSRLIGEEKKEPPKFDKSMLTNGRFGYIIGEGWFVVVGDKIIYENGGYDLLEKMNSSGKFSSGYGVKSIVEARSFNNARNGPSDVIWKAPDFDPTEAK